MEIDVIHCSMTGLILPFGNHGLLRHEGNVNGVWQEKKSSKYISDEFNFLCSRLKRMLDILKR